MYEAICSIHALGVLRYGASGQHDRIFTHRKDMLRNPNTNPEMKP